MGEFKFHPVTPERWADLAEFFSQNGNPNYCWCQRWRLKSSEFGQVSVSVRREKLAELVQANIPVGVLAYQKGQAVGWCSIAPRETYVALERARVLKRIDERPVWSVACFFIDRHLRGQGLATALLAAAVSYARSQGATIVEGYPIEPDQSYQFMGASIIFAQVGFEHAATAVNGRPIVRLYLKQPN